MAANRPHYHVWRLARGGRMYYRLRRSFHTRQAARQWFVRYVRRWRPESTAFEVKPCDREECRPKLD